MVPPEVLVGEAGGSASDSVIVRRRDCVLSASRATGTAVPPVSVRCGACIICCNEKPAWEKKNGEKRRKKKKKKKKEDDAES